jgi:hypothetical protein
MKTQIPERNLMDVDFVQFSSLDLIIDLLHKGCAGWRTVEKQQAKRSKKSNNSAVESNPSRQVLLRVLADICGPEDLRGLADLTGENLTQVRTGPREDVFRGLISRLVANLRPRDSRVLIGIASLEGGAFLRMQHLECVLRVARALFELLADAGHLDRWCGRIPTAQLLSFLHRHSDENRNQYIKYVKWWSSTLLAKHLRNECEAPPAMDSDLYAGLSGSLRFLLRRSVVVDEGPQGLSYFRMLTSIQQLKRAFLPVDEDFVLDSLVKHKKAMMRPPGPMDSGTLLVVPKLCRSNPELSRITRVPAAPDVFVREVTARMRNVLAGFKPAAPRLMQPSGSACFESSRAKGGASQFLADAYFHEKNPATKDGEIVDCFYFDEETGYGAALPVSLGAIRDNTGELLAMDYMPHHGVKEIRGFPYPRLESVVSEITDRLFAYRQPVDFRRKIFEQMSLPLDVMTKGPEENGPDNVNCRVAAVLEPGKVRTVTAGEARPYWVSRSFQKDIHSYIRQIPQFSLSGQPLERWHLKFLDRLAGEYGLFQGRTLDGERTVWVSGDYSGATDEIDIRLTRACHKLMMDRFRQSNRELSSDLVEQYVLTLDSCIEPHVVSYPKNLVDDEPEEGAPDLRPCRQLNGQLMGSTLSFPILCIVNFCVAWLALFPHVQDYRKIPILVNGDDILFRCRESQYTTWCDHIKNAGFRRSVGKNFAHVDKIFINSQPWIARKRSDFLETKLCEFEYLPFFNPGMLYGQSKVAKKPSVEGESGGTYQALYSLQPEAVSGAQNRERAVRRFNSIHREHLKHASANGFFSYHAPRELYGLGMVPTEKAQYTMTQRIVANILVRKGLELSKAGKLYIGDGHVSKPIHDLSRIQGRRMLYRGCIVPPEKIRSGITSGFTVLQKLERRELGLTQDVITEQDGEKAMMSTAYDLARKLQRKLKRADESTRVPYPERLMERGFCQRPLREDEIFQGIMIGA